MKRGWVVRINLEDGQAPEFGKTRPGIIFSNDEHNAVLPTVVIIPLSTRPPMIWPLRISLPDLRGLKSSFAVVPGIRQVSKSRILDQVGQVPEAFLDELQDACFAYLGD